MLLPLIYAVNKITERHMLLSKTIGTRPEENVSYMNVQIMLATVVALFIVGSSVEVAAYLVFNYKVHPWRDLLRCDEQHSTDKTEISTQEMIVIVEDERE